LFASVLGACDTSRCQHCSSTILSPRDLSPCSSEPFFAPARLSLPFHLVALLTFDLHSLSQVLEARIRNPLPKTSFADSLRKVWATRQAVTSKLSVALKRPPTMLFTDGVLAVSCIYYAFIYANLFLFLVSVSSPLPSSLYVSLSPELTCLVASPLPSDSHPLPRR